MRITYNGNELEITPVTEDSDVYIGISKNSGYQYGVYLDKEELRLIVAFLNLQISKIEQYEKGE